MLNFALSNAVPVIWLFCAYHEDTCPRWLAWSVAIHCNGIVDSQWNKLYGIFMSSCCSTWDVQLGIVLVFAMAICRWQLIYITYPFLFLQLNDNAVVLLPLEIQFFLVRYDNMSVHGSLSHLIVTLSNLFCIYLVGSFNMLLFLWKINTG